MLVALRRDQEALIDIEFIRANAAREMRAAYMQSIILKRSGKGNEAKAVLAEAEQLLKKRDPEFVRNHPPSLLLLGAIGYARSNYEDSYKYLHRYLEIAQNHAGARKMMGSMLLRKNDAWEAIKILKPAPFFTPKDTEIYILLADAYMRAKKFSDATVMLEKATTLAPGTSRIRTQLGLSRLAVQQSRTTSLRT